MNCEEEKASTNSWIGEVQDVIKVQGRRHRIGGSAEGDLDMNGDLEVAVNQG